MGYIVQENNGRDTETFSKQVFRQIRGTWAHEMAITV